MPNADNFAETWVIRGAAGGVPEPGSWAMILLGFGAIGMAMRRNRAPLLAHAD
jgi:hypothetical protein